MERNKDFRFPIGTIVQHFKRETITDEERAANMYLYPDHRLCRAYGDEGDADDLSGVVW